MTDLLKTDAEAHMDDLVAAGAASTSPGAADGGDTAKVRTFRAATLDDAVAAARTEFGQEVELREAHRVRRGGLGGFFATDLGVEIVAAPAGPAPAATPGAADGRLDPSTGFPAPSTKRIDDESLSAIERLIGDAESADRIGDAFATAAEVDAPLYETIADAQDFTQPEGPYDYAVDEPVSAEPHPFASAIESELAAATGIVAGAADARAAAAVIAQQTADDISIEVPSEPVLPSAPTIAEPIARVEDPSTIGLLPEPNGPVAPAPAVEDAEPAPRLPEVSLAPAADTVAGPDEADAPEARTATKSIPRPPMPVLKTSAQPQSPSATKMEKAGEFTADEMLASIFSLGGRGEKSFSRISFNVTTDDGTTMSVAADFNGDESE